MLASVVADILLPFFFSKHGWMRNF